MNHTVHNWTGGLAFLVMAAPSIAADWKLISTNQQEDIFIDAESISALPNHNRKAWVRRVMRDGAEVPEYFRADVERATYHWRLELLHANCPERMSKPVSLTYYDIGGRVVGSYDFRHAEFRDVVPESIGETILYAICRFPL